MGAVLMIEDQASTGTGLYQVGQKPWRYYSEYYPKGTKLAMLVIDSGNLFDHGGAIVPTFGWMAEQAGYAIQPKEIGRAHV